MAEVVIRAWAPVYAHVEVDIDADGRASGEVVKVVVGDEEIDHSDATVISTEGVEEGEGKTAAAAALEIYEDPDEQWPVWSFGY